MGLDFQAEVKDSSRIWIAAGFTDLRRVFQGLTTLVETVLEQVPYSGHVFVFRGKRGDLIKVFQIVESLFTALCVQGIITINVEPLSKLRAAVMVPPCW